MNTLEIAQRCAEVMFARDSASRALGISIEVSEVGSARARMEITPSMVNGFGVCHGGYIFTLADSAFAFACNGYDRVTLAAGATIDFVRSARLGDRLLAEASERYRGRSSGIYDVTVSNQDGRLVAQFRGRSHSTGDPVITGE
ncbi:MAG: hydroxyphenylacetyl-CoA thioesterase PaaI [Woeseia sp.]